MIGELIRRPNYLSQNFEEDLDSALLEEISFSEKLKKISKENEMRNKPTSLLLNDDINCSSDDIRVKEVESVTHITHSSSFTSTKPPTSSFHHPDSPVSSKPNGLLKRPQSVSSFSSLFHSPSALLFRSQSLKCKLGHECSPKYSFNLPVSKYMLRRLDLEKKRKKIYIRRKFLYPLAMISLLVLMSFTLLMVSCNIAELIITGKVFRTESKEAMVLGGSSLSSFGLVGASLEVAVILYLMLTSLVGVYSLPGFKRLEGSFVALWSCSVFEFCLIIIIYI